MMKSQTQQTPTESKLLRSYRWLSQEWGYRSHAEGSHEKFELLIHRYPYGPLMNYTDPVFRALQQDRFYYECDVLSKFKTAWNLDHYPEFAQPIISVLQRFWTTKIEEGFTQLLHQGRQIEKPSLPFQGVLVAIEALQAIVQGETNRAYILIQDFIEC